MAPPLVKRIPKRLTDAPLLEAVWELRFDGEESASAGLPGMLLGKFHAAGREMRLEEMPLAAVPREVRKTQESLRYAPVTALRSENWAVLIGDRVAALSVARPYPGWATFRSRIVELWNWLKETGLTGEPRGFSLKYIDFFPGSPCDTLKLLSLQVRVGEMVPQAGEIRLQLPIVFDDHAGLVQILNPVSPGGVPLEAGSSGLVTDVLINCPFAVGDEADFGQRLDQAKTLCHRVFFSLLRPDTIEARGPIYED